MNGPLRGTITRDRERLVLRIQAMQDFMRGFAELLSLCRDRAACVIFPTDLSGVAAIGYTGPMSGSPNICKVPASSPSAGCHCVSGIMNALVKFRPDIGKDYAMSTTRQPTAAEAALIGNLWGSDGTRMFKAVIYDVKFTCLHTESMHTADGLPILTEAGIAHMGQWEIRPDNELLEVFP